jgi:hypothetical protein
MWWTEWHWGRFPPNTSVPLANHFTDCSTLILIRGCYNRLNSGRRTNWTQSHRPQEEKDERALNISEGLIMGSKTNACTWDFFEPYLKWFTQINGIRSNDLGKKTLKEIYGPKCEQAAWRIRRNLELQNAYVTRYCDWYQIRRLQRFGRVIRLENISIPEMILNTTP